MDEKSKVIELKPDVASEEVDKAMENTEKPQTNAARYMQVGFPGGKKKVSRDEFVAVISQIADNINQIGDYLMQDVNMMYSRQVFPFQIRLAVLEDILIEKGITTKEQISELAAEKIKKLEEQAKEIKAQQESEKKDIEADKAETSEESDPE